MTAVFCLSVKTPLFYMSLIERYSSELWRFTIQFRKIQNDGIGDDQAGMLVRLGGTGFMSDQKEDRGGTSGTPFNH